MMQAMITRTNADLKHGKLTKSLTLSRMELRDHFTHESDLFRSLATSPITTKTTQTGSSRSEQSSTPPAISKEVKDDVIERIQQCCKRVRIWRRHTPNPLLQYKQQMEANISLKTSSKSTDHRMHLPTLMKMIVEVYEQKMIAESGAATQPSTGGITETFPEFIVRYVASHTTSRRAASEQLNSAVMSLVLPSSHARVRVFASLCGLDEHGFNPHERVMAFLHMVECTHRYKVQCGGVSGNMPIGQRIDQTSMVDVVFHNVGMPQIAVQRVITELFEEEYYWNFRFWHSHFRELRVKYAWPVGAKEDLIERAMGLATVSRNVALNATRKIDVDLFLELLLNAWTQRAKYLVDQLEAATDLEERKNAAVLQHKQMIQDAKSSIIPLTSQEIVIFDELVQEFWHAEVPWMDRHVQRKLLPVSHTRPLMELITLYKKYVNELDDSKRVWEWSRWPWDSDWEWGAIIVTNGLTHQEENENP